MNNIVKSVVFAAVVLFAGIAAMQVIYKNQDATTDATMVEPAAGEEAVVAPAAEGTMTEDQADVAKDAVEAQADAAKEEIKVEEEAAKDAAEVAKDAAEADADAAADAVDANADAAKEEIDAHTAE